MATILQIGKQMTKSPREKRALFNKWMALAPDIQVEREEISSIVESDPMSWEELITIRENLGYIQTEFAALLETPVSTYQKWERDPEIDGAVNIPIRMAKQVRIFHNLPVFTYLSLEKFRKG